MHPVFLFDIDGTLLSVKKQFSRPFIGRCLETCELDLLEFSYAAFAGRTDRDIFLSLINGHPETDKKYDELKSTYIRLLEEELEPGHVDICAGARESVEFCLENDIPVALLTGNYRESAFIKLNRAGLDHFFTHGSFGCDHTDRNKLAENALADSESWFGRKTEPTRTVVIGDTPRDIECARHAGFNVVAVSTGHYSADELMRLNPDMLLNSLEMPHFWINSCIDLINGN